MCSSLDLLITMGLISLCCLSGAIWFSVEAWKACRG
jgi:hypothetical protein